MNQGRIAPARVAGPACNVFSIHQQNHVQVATLLPPLIELSGAKGQTGNCALSSINYNSNLMLCREERFDIKNILN